MKQLDNIPRVKRIIIDTIKRLKLDLTGMSVLTEAASGNFIVTPLIAALAGAKKVYVVSRDTRYGAVREILEYLNTISISMGIDDSIIEYVDDKNTVASEVDIVTNSGHVRPIDREFIQHLKPTAAIPLMFESWEFRHEDIDLETCIEYNIPILGTNERDPYLHIFRYVGLCALKLLFESQIEVYRSNILLLSSGEYLKEIKEVLASNGANVTCINTLKSNERILLDKLSEYDAIVVAEQENKKCLIGEPSDFINEKMLRRSNAVVIHIAGVLDYEVLDRCHVVKYPSDEIHYGYMTVTTDYVGVRPVIELNTGSLKVGQALIEGKKIYSCISDVQKYAIENSPAMSFQM